MGRSVPYWLNSVPNPCTFKTSVGLGSGPIFKAARLARDGLKKSKTIINVLNAQYKFRKTKLQNAGETFVGSWF